MPETTDEPVSRIEKLEKAIRDIQTEQILWKANFAEIAISLVELTTENLALWEILHARQSGSPAMYEAKREMEGLRSEARGMRNSGPAQFLALLAKLRDQRKTHQ